MDEGEPVVVRRILAEWGRAMGVEVVPDQRDGAAELDVCADEQVAVVLRAESLASGVARWLEAGAIDEPGRLPGLVAVQGGDGDPTPGAAPGPHHGGVAASAQEVRVAGTSRTRPRPRRRSRCHAPPLCFRLRPYLLLPKLHRILVALQSAAGRALPGPAVPVHQPPGPRHQAGDPELPGDHLLDQDQGPSLVLPAMGRRPAHQLRVQHGKPGVREPGLFGRPAYRMVPAYRRDQVPSPHDNTSKRSVVEAD